MKQLIKFSLLIAALATVCGASDETLARGLPGAYTRQTFSMYTETISLSADRSYLFTFRFDIGSEEEHGTWKVQDSILILSPKKHGKPKGWPSQFRILSIDDDLALSVIDSASDTGDEENPTRLFKPEKKKANQSSATPPAVTDRADARSAPAVGVAHLTLGEK